MKEILINIAVLLYFMISIFVLLLTMASPFTYGTDFPCWIYCIIYPLAILIMASQRKCIEIIDTKTNFLN